MKKSAILLVVASTVAAALTVVGKERKESPHKTPVAPVARNMWPLVSTSQTIATASVPLRVPRGASRVHPQASPKELEAWFVAELEKLERPTAAMCDNVADPLPEKDDIPLEPLQETDKPELEQPEPEGGGFWTDDIYLDSNLGVSFSLPDRWSELYRGEPPAAQPDAGWNGFETLLHRSVTTSAGRFEPGSWNGAVYANRSLELSFHLPMGWSACTPEEMFANYGTVEGVRNEMAAQDGETGNNLLLMVQDLATVIGGGAMTAEAYARILRRQLEDMDELSYQFEEGCTTVLAGRTWWTLEANVCPADGNQERDGMRQLFLFHKLGTSMIAINVYLIEGLTADAVMGAMAFCS